MTAANVSQAIAEVVGIGSNPPVRVAQLVMEVVAIKPPPQVNVSQAFMEVVAQRLFRVLTWDGIRVDGGSA